MATVFWLNAGNSLGPQASEQMKGLGSEDPTVYIPIVSLGQPLHTHPSFQFCVVLRQASLFLVPRVVLRVK